MINFDFLVTGTLLTLAATQPQPANPCPLVKPAEINVTPTARQVRYDTSKTLQELQETEVDTINPYGFHGVTMTQGYMAGQVSLKQQIKLGTSINPRTGAACIWYDKINIPIEVEPVIFIAREVYEDSCMRDVVIDHEMKHVMADRKVVNKFARTVGQKVYTALAERGFRAQPVSSQNAEDMANRMYKVVNQVIDFEYKKFDLERMEEQAKIDSLQEYERMSSLCPDYHNKVPAWASSRSYKSR